MGAKQNEAGASRFEDNWYQVNALIDRKLPKTGPALVALTCPLAPIDTQATSESSAALARVNIFSVRITAA